MQAGGACFQVTTCSSAFNTALFTACASSHPAFSGCQHKHLALHASESCCVSCGSEACRGCFILATCTPCNKPHSNMSLLPTAVTLHA